MSRRKLYEDGSPPKLRPYRNDGPKPQRNGKCPCGSGVKFKKCCGAPAAPPRAIPEIYTTLRSQYNDDQKAAEEAFVRQWGFGPSPAQLLTFMKGDQQEIKDLILRGMHGINADPKFIYAVDKLNRLLTPKNKSLYTEEEQQEWQDALTEYENKASFQLTPNAK